MILLIAVIPVVAQSPTDSLEGALQRSPADTGRVRTLNLLIRQFEYTDTAKAARYARESVALSRKLQDTYGLAVAYRLSGILAVDRSDLEEASRLYDTAGQLLSGQKDRGYQVQQALLLQNQSAVCQFREQYRQAVTLCLDAATLLAGLHEESYLFFCYNNLAVLYGYLEDKTSSLKYAQAAYDISAKYHDPFRMGMAGIELASTRMELNGMKE